MTCLPPARPTAPLSGVFEGLARNGEPVDPGLELARDAEIAHGRADDDEVGGEELGEGGLSGDEIAFEIDGFRDRALGRRQVGAREMAHRRCS